MMFKRSANIAALLLLLIAPLGLTGTVLCEHSGATDPLTGCWEQFGAGVGVEVGPVFNDQGHDAWMVRDVDPRFPIPEQYLEYRKYLTPSEVSAADRYGWILSVLLRVMDAPDPVDFAVYSAYTNGNREYTLQFGAQPDGDPLVWLNGLATPLDLDGSGSGYHWYQLRYDSLLQNADLFVDGVERLSDFVSNPGGTGAVPQVGWGAGGGPGTGEGNFAGVRFEIVPEPGTATTTACTLLALGVLLRRKFRGFLS